MNGYTETFNGFDLELIFYDQIYDNLSIVSNSFKYFEIMNNYE